MASTSLLVFLTIGLGAVYAAPKATTASSVAPGERGQSPQQLLYDHVMRDYSSDVAPTFDGRPVDVVLDPTLETILCVDEEKGTVEYTQWFLMWWTDDHFKWNPAQFNNLDEIWLHASDIWHPDVTGFETISCESTMDKANTFARVKHDGWVRLTIPQKCKIQCPMQMNKFPIGEHKCTVRYVSWIHPNTKMTLRNYDAFDLSSDINARNDLWDVTGTDVKMESVDYKVGFFDLVHYSFTLKRDFRGSGSGTGPLSKNELVSVLKNGFPQQKTPVNRTQSIGGGQRRQGKGQGQNHSPQEDPRRRKPPAVLD